MGGGVDVGAGILLGVLGAILTFAVNAEPPGINLKMVGIILMVAAALVILLSLRGSRRERIITRIIKSRDPNSPSRTVQDTIEERDND